MRKRTVRLIIVLALVSIIGITVTQLYWVVSKYRQEKEDLTGNHFHPITKFK